MNTNYAWNRHRFTDLARLGEAARAGGMAFGPVTIQQGERLLTLLAEAVQYREAHAHSQQLRAEAEAQCAALRLAIDKACNILSYADNDDEAADAAFKKLREVVAQCDGSDSAPVQRRWRLGDMTADQWDELLGTIDPGDEQ